jgi:CheY-like chemotaxis protein
VDDNRTNRTLVAEYLEEEGFTVRTAASGPAALTCLETHRVALALVDVQMPGMDGLELTRLIRTHADSRIAAMRLVGLTALAMSGDQERCLAAGMNSYLAKPFALSTLSELLRQFQEEDMTDRQ